MLFEFIKTASRYVLPSVCILCGRLKNQDLCADCQKDLPILSHHCRRCAQFLAIDGVCGACVKIPPPFDITHALFPYEPPIIHLIKQLKFAGELCYAHVLGQLLAEKIQQEWYREKLLPNLIIPVPLHPKRLMERGFNQAIEIARPIVKALQIPLDRHGVKRIKHTVAQSTLAANRRDKNVHQAFSVVRDYSGQHIALLDDVITTGSTISEISFMLKKHGAVKIDVWCCART